MAGWQPKLLIDYTPNGEDLGGFAERYQAVVEEQIFALLNALRSGNATAGLDETDTAAYSMRINTVDNGIYMRNRDNTEWVLLGYVEDFLGLDATKIGAIINGGGLKKMRCGKEEDLPQTDNSTNDFYFAYDTSRLFIWTGVVWKVFLSLQFGDMLDYEKYCVAKEEVLSGSAREIDPTTNLPKGAGKIPRLDPVTGKGNFDITGSPDMLLGYLIDVQNLKDGDTLVYNAEKNKMVNLPHSAYSKDGNIDLDALADIVGNKITAETLASFMYEAATSFMYEAASSVISETADNVINRISTAELDIADLDRKIAEVEDNIGDNYAPIDSPAFTGTPTTPSIPASTNNNRVAPANFVQGLISSLRTELKGHVADEIEDNGFGVTASDFDDWNIDQTTGVPTGAWGYLRFKNGMTLQWGTSPISAGQTVFKFPFAFPNGVRAVFTTLFNPSGENTEGTVTVKKWTKTNCTIYTKITSGTATAAALLAIGW